MNFAIYPDLANSCVFITGGASGIGKALVQAFYQQGAKVAFIDNQIGLAEELCLELSAGPNPAPFFQYCDVTDITALQHCIAETTKQFGPIQVLINNAGSDQRQQFSALTAAEWQQSLNINLTPHFFTAQAVASGMKVLQKGSIINLSSNSAMLGLTGYPAYVAAKSAILGLSKSLARELGPDGIRVNSLVPGWVLTEKQQRLWATPEALAECLAQQALKQHITEQDIAAAALFLASDASRMMTGQALIIDGGRV
jgi:NAD(P)-dependent dehydrogenase (short-subunit alcohol dehydrogenase family)